MKLENGFVRTRDVPKLLRIDKDCYGKLAHSEDELLDNLRQRDIISLAVTLYNEPQKLYGFMMYKSTKKRILLLHIAVDPTLSKQERSQVFNHLISPIVKKLSLGNKTSICMFVRESWLWLQLALKEAKFVASDVLRHYYEDTNEDAYVFDYAIEESQETEDGPEIVML